MPKCCVLAGTSWYIETFTWVVVTCVGFPIPFGNGRLEKPVNMRDSSYVTPPIVVVTVSFFPLPITSDFAMYIHVAAHFRSGFSGGEIRWLRRLRREGSPERLSRSYQLACRNVATRGGEYTL